MEQFERVFATCPDASSNLLRVARVVVEAVVDEPLQDALVPGVDEVRMACQLAARRERDTVAVDERVANEQSDQRHFHRV
jgi:hypothetical protein